MSDEEDEDFLAMQARCPHCLTEQYALSVPAFSRGTVPCWRCRQLTEPMNDDEYREALRLARYAASDDE